MRTAFILLAGLSLVLAGCDNAPAPVVPADAAFARGNSGNTPAMLNRELAVLRRAAAGLEPGGTVVYRAEMRVEEPPAEPFILIHALLDFQPGTWFPAHVHGGPTLYTVVEGSVEVHDEGSVTEYRAGESYQHELGHAIAAGNLGEEPSAMVVAFVLPEGAELITFHQVEDAGAELPAPEIPHQLATAPLVRSSPFTVVQLVIDVEPGTWTPMHSQPGPSLFTVLDGEVTLRIPGAEEQVVPSGDGWSLAAGQPTVVGNPGGSTARLVGTYLVPVGEALGRLNR